MSADTMGDLLYERKFNEMQRYIPFLDRVIEKLKNNDHDKPRKAQLEKMQMLHNLLNNKQKKLKIETLLKCESVLKKLHAKIEKSDELSPPNTLHKPSITTTPTAYEIISNKDHQIPSKSSGPTHTTSISEAKFVPKSSGVNEINTCPASPVHFGDEDFRPPVEIPMERRCSPVRVVPSTHWDHHMNKPQQEPSNQHSGRFQNRSSDYYHNNSKYQQQPLPERPKSSHSRWSDSRDRSTEASSIMPSSNSSSYHRSWSSTSSSASSTNHRPHSQQRTLSKKAYSSEEENWDDPEDEQPIPTKPAVKSSLPLPMPSASSSSHNQHRESSSSHQHRHHEKGKLGRDLQPPSFSPLPDIALDNDACQQKLYHDTIYKYKKPDPPKVIFNPFMNPPPPELSTSTSPVSNIFNRLGDKVDRSFENFRIEVKNDKMKPKPSKPTPILAPPVVPIKPIDEVLKSPPLSADDIDDLLNESLEAALGKPTKPKTVEFIKESKATALELVRKKLAMISKPSQSGMESPPRTANNDQVEKEPFYRRGHTPTKKNSVKYTASPQSPQREHFKPPTASLKNHSEPSPTSPPNTIDPIIERLALKYHPHRRQDSISATSQEKSQQKTDNKASIQSPPVQKNDSTADRLAFKYNPHPRRDSMVSPHHTIDPRVGKILGKIPPLVGSPVAVSPVPNILPAINLYDPRLRNSRLTSVEPAAPFCTPIPYSSPIPSLMDINVSNPLPVTGGAPLKASFNMTAASRLDPRKKKLSAKIYTEKFNPERNDQTERMKYLESKKKKPPEPKTYGEYKQSKCRQNAIEEASKVSPVSDANPIIPSVLSTTPSTIDKMYRNADYGKELGGSIHGFKIPKKVKAEEVKEKEEKSKNDDRAEEPKSEESKNKPEESIKNIDESTKKQEDDLVNKSDKPVEKVDETVKKPDASKLICEEYKHSTEKHQESVKPIEVEQNINLSESTDKSSSECDLVIDEIEDMQPEPIMTRGRCKGRPKSIKTENISPEVHKPDDLAVKPKEEPLEIQEEEVKPRRIATRRLTIKEPPKEEKNQRSGTLSPPPSTRCRSASDIFAPTTDNSIVSTQNIISGKRKTRASMNFNEKGNKKPPTPKTTPANSPATTPKVTAKTAPKAVKNAKKSTPVNTRLRRQATGGKQSPDDGQICAVSSTTSQGGDPDDLQNDDSMTIEEVGSSEEPSSSGSKPQTPLVDADENEKKQEWLEGFLKSIVDPTTNKDRILDMLKTVLDEKKLQQVKDILYSPEDGGRDTPVNAKKPMEQNKPRPTRTKKNELDRLNEDIRDMFICQGVVTATGRRMCTLAKETSKEKPTKPKEPSKERKSRLKDSISSATPSPTLSCKRGMRRAKVIISPLNMRALRSQSRKESHPSKMPVLEPNTPIKLPGEDIDEADDKVELVQLPKNKPRPKSKLPPSIDLNSDDDDDDIQLVHLKKRMKRDDEKEQKEQAENKEEEEKEEKLEMIKDEKEHNKEEEDVKTVKKVKKVDEKVEAEPEEVLPKNINPEWHTMSDYSFCCVICRERARYIAPHYLTAHNDSEVYTSRLSPTVLEDIKLGIGNRALYAMQKKPNLTAFHYRCPFCDFQATSTLRGWLEHFTIHTGEYQYKCSGCFKAMNGCTHLMDHIKKHCPEAKKINRQPINLRGHSIIGYVCHLCNYIQMLRSGVVRHLKMQHELDDASSIACIIEVKLIDSAGAPKMEESIQTTEEMSAPLIPNVTINKPAELDASNQVNLQVFLSRELASPTSDVLTERLKSIDQDDGITSDSSVITVSPYKGTQAPATRITIAEKLSQRFKNIEKQNLLDDVIVDEIRTEGPSSNSQVETVSSDNEPPSDGKSSHASIEVKESSTCGTVTLPQTSPTSEVIGCPSVDSFNESGNLIIDEQEGDKSTVGDDGSDSELADDNDEDDNENWEDIEITETKGTSQKDKNKNKSIFETLSRLYASIAPKKVSKKPKEKEKEKRKTETPPPTQNQQPPLPPPLPSANPSMLPTPPQPPPPQISNLSELLPDSPSDSLDMLLATNFNCLEGDGTSFPHLDLNDLDSPIFLLSEEQTNLQDAIAMATDLDQIKYDVLGDPLPPPAIHPPMQLSSATSAQRIGNFGFSLSGDSLKYYCKVKGCTFLFSDHPDGLQNHFLLEHPTLRWDGYCHTCQSKICPEGGREMQHMMDVHSKPRAEEQTGEKPRIKFRRLTGDILSTGKKPAPPPPPPLSSTTPLVIKEIQGAHTPELCLSTMLQSEPRAMIQPTPPPAFETDIPLYKNVSKEFTITAVAEGVTDDYLRKLVLNQSESTPGGMQISQVISLNAGGKSISPAPLSMDYSQISDMIPAFEHRNPTSLSELHDVLQFSDNLSHSNSPTPLQIDLPFRGSIPALNQGRITAATKANSPVPRNQSPKPPAFKCCAAQCVFSTNLRSAMNEHLAFHLRTDKDRGSLKCNECAFMGRNITDYFQHLAHEHSSSSTSPCPPTNELTQKIQNILRATSNPSKSSEEEQRDSPKLDTTNQSFVDRLKKVVEETLADTGMSESELWKCPFYPECTTPITEKDFLGHVAKHMTSFYPSRAPGATLHCPHCTVNYHRAAILKAHIKAHSRHQYFCYICCTTFVNLQQAQKHSSEVHGRPHPVYTQPLMPEGTLGKPIYLVSFDKLSTMEVIQFGEKLLAEWERKKSLNKTHYQPHEQYLLPIQPIFNNQVFCSVCNYKTKVRTNMFRHLQLHKQEVDVASVDPVNPVPCLEKNEKHFDKMLNLACSSNATGSGAKPKEATGTIKIPNFVPDMRRYVCGHPGCTYLTITDHMLRSHLNALHSGEKGYQCPHCQEDICKKNLCAERIIQHLKFHGPKIYQCGECEYIHYTKHVIERHVHDKHSAVPLVNLMTYDRAEGEVNKTTQLVVGKSAHLAQSTGTDCESSAPSAPVPSALPINKFKWECALCKHQTVTWNQMISHANSTHRAKHQYQCVHCVFGSAHLSHIMEHIDTKHPTKTREAKYIFYKINETPQDKAADTRPLWSRDDPKRVRSIRGILMENEEDAERTKQSLSKSGVDLDDDDDDVEIVQVIEPESGMKPSVLGCFHCDFKNEVMATLTNHWKTNHWCAKNNELVPKLPFFFRILSTLKCPSCPYLGDYASMQQHSYKHSQRTFYATDPKLPNTCGHCPFVYPPKRLDILAKHYQREHKPTDVKNLSSSLLKSVLALGDCQVYMQCYFCAEICADKMTIIEHERERHGSSNFRYKQIKDEVIYRCGMCQYSSTNEMATLRHMVDHYSRFKRCNFCMQDQSSFNAYMQHCYTSHPEELNDFKKIYTLIDMKVFLGQMLLIFPNGLIVNKRNLVHTQYGSTERISAMYDEICKKALEPPIPPLCMARLMAKKSIETKEHTPQRPLLPPPPVPVTPVRIAKRRMTVAMGAGDRGLTDLMVSSGRQKIRKRKASISEDRPIPPAPLFSTITAKMSDEEKNAIVIKNNDRNTADVSLGVSFYGKQPEPVDLSKIYTKIAIGDKYAPVSVKKFALLIKMNAKVMVDKMDFAKYRAQKRRKIIHRPCPASKKKRSV